MQHQRPRRWQFFWLCAFVIGASGCSEKPSTAWSGYVEGDYVYIAAPLAGRLDLLAVQAGQSVARGAVLFELDAQAERLASDEALARLRSARAQAANLDTGRRSDEIAVNAAQLEQAQANAAGLRNDLLRQQQLVSQGFISKARLDDASTALRQAQARVAELTAALRVARLPARPDERLATQASANAAQEVLLQNKWREQQKQQTSPEDALVSDVFFRLGEFVPAGQAVLALLPPGNVKARFFIPEGALAKISAGQAVLLDCDGCQTPIPARVTRIASQAEYTPPVIYSNAQRAKMVFMVEAKPDKQDAVRLHPGQPLDVRLAAVDRAP